MPSRRTSRGSRRCPCAAILATTIAVLTFPATFGIGPFAIAQSRVPQRAPEYTAQTPKASAAASESSPKSNGAGNAASAADGDDLVNAKLDQAKQAYAMALEKFNEAVLAYLEKREETARKGGNKKVVDQIKAERAAFNDLGELPKGASSALRKKLSAARAVMESAYDAAVREYTRAKLDNQADATQKELDAFRKTGETTQSNTFFNGKDLAGWSALPGLWSVRGGALIGSTRNKTFSFNTCLCSDRNYGDFELRCKVKLSGTNPNSGIQIRSELFDAKMFIVRGPQCDIGEGYWGCLYGESAGGMLKQADQAAVAGVLKKNDFNDFYIRAVGKRIVITVNGLTTVDQLFPEIPDQGIIAWQLHHPGEYEVTFKDIQFKDLGEPDSSNARPRGGQPDDKLAPNSVWANDSWRLAIFERDGNTFRGRFEGLGIIREMTGSIDGRKISWLSKDVRAVKGRPGGDNFGEVNGDTIDFTWRDPDGKGGSFSLRLQAK